MMMTPIITRIKQPGRTRTTLLTMGIALLFIIGFIVPATSIVADSLDEMIPKDKEATALYNLYSPTHYAFQTVPPERKFWEVGAKANDSIASVYDHLLSLVFIGTAQITRFFNFIAREAFEFSFMNRLIDAVADILRNLTGINNGFLGTSFWGTMIGLIAPVVLFYGLFQLIRFRFLESIQTFTSFLVALVVALVFFSQAGTVLKFINQAGEEIGTTMYAGLAKATGLETDNKKGITLISEQVWNEFVMRPYKMLQYDDAAIKDDVIAPVLKSDPFSDDRKKLLQNLLKTYPAIAKDRMAEQMVLIIFNFIFALIILGFFCFWAIYLIFIKIKFLIHAATMGVTLLAAMLPGREAGLSVVRGQFLKLVGLGWMSVMTMFFLDLSLVMGHFTFDIVAVQAKAGWFTGLIIEAIVIYVIFKYREEMGSVFTKAAGAIPAMAKPKASILSTARNLTSTVNHAKQLFGGTKEPEGVPRNFQPGALHRADTDLNQATSASMMLRYQKEKSSAVQIAGESGEPVKHTPFVKSVDDNLRNNAKNPFRGMDKEWKEEKGRLKTIKDDGGSVKQAILNRGITNDMNDQEAASTMYNNESMIRGAASHMTNRPREAVAQVNRAKTLNSDRKMQNSVADYTMLNLWERYKVERGAAFQKSNATGEPIQHSQFVKDMDGRFKQAGIHSTSQINEVMLSKSKRLSIAPHFESSSAYIGQKDKLLQSNEAFRKATPSSSFISDGPQINRSAPISHSSVMKQMPNLPNSSVVPSPRFDVTRQPNVKTKIGKINVSGDLHNKMNESRSKLSTVQRMDGWRLEVNTGMKTERVVNLQNKVTTKVSNALNEEQTITRIKNNVSRQEASVDMHHKSIANNIASKSAKARNLRANKKIK